MKSFQFSLQKALEWRRIQLQLAEARVEQQLAALAAIDQARAELDAMGQRTEVEVRQFQPLAGGDLGALGSFRLAVKGRGRDLAIKRLDCQKELLARQTVMIEARRRCRLLERLKDKRSAEWQSVADRELEEMASDSYLSQWAHRHASSL